MKTYWIPSVFGVPPILIFEVIKECLETSRPQHRNTGAVEEGRQKTVWSLLVCRGYVQHIVNCCSCGRKRTYLTNFICAMAKTYQIP